MYHCIKLAEKASVLMYCLQESGGQKRHSLEHNSVGKARSKMGSSYIQHTEDPQIPGIRWTTWVDTETHVPDHR